MISSLADLIEKNPWAIVALALLAIWPFVKQVVPAAYRILRKVVRSASKGKDHYELAGRDLHFFVANAVSACSFTFLFAALFFAVQLTPIQSLPWLAQVILALAQLGAGIGIGIIVGDLLVMSLVVRLKREILDNDHND